MSKWTPEMWIGFCFAIIFTVMMAFMYQSHNPPSKVNQAQFVQPIKETQYTLDPSKTSAKISYLERLSKQAILSDGWVAKIKMKIEVYTQLNHDKKISTAGFVIIDEFDELGKVVRTWSKDVQDKEKWSFDVLIGDNIKKINITPHVVYFYSEIVAFQGDTLEYTR